MMGLKSAVAALAATIIVGGCDTLDKPVTLEPVSSRTVAGYSTISRAFNDVCLGMASNLDVNAAFKRAEKYGVKPIALRDGGGMGFSTRSDLSVQIDANSNGGDCVVTTSAMNPDPLDTELVGLASNFAQRTGGTTTTRGVAYFVNVGKRVYLFRHDNRGGEALVFHIRRRL